MTDASVALVIPAKDEAARVGATVAAAFKLPAVDIVVVVDDGSADGTASAASAAGASVVSHSTNRGKAAAMETGANAVSLIDQREGLDGHRLLLFLDADLEESAANAGPLIEPVAAGVADMTIATLPPQRTAGGGFGYVVKLARAGIAQATGWTATQPLSGQRCLTWDAYRAAVPLAPGWGVEVGMTIDLLRAGFRVQEVEVPFHHRVTGTEFAAHLHRARQLRDVGWTLAARGVRPRLASRE
ncbi:MAG TPA: glycosyltransferase [Jiangellaceae bacterium]